MTFPTISMRDLECYVDQGADIMIIDLRNQSSFCNCHFKGAVNIPYDQLEQQLCCLPMDKTLVFYCSRGGQSLLACNHLSRLGYRTVNIANGISFYNGKYMVRA